MERDSGGAGAIRAAARPLHHPMPPSRDKEAGPKVSCLRCRDQKLKCDRGLPNCVRCRRQRAKCTYPPPPDRRRNTRRKPKPRLSEASVPPSGADRSPTPGSDPDAVPMDRPSPEDTTGRQGCACVSSPAPSSNNTPGAEAVDAADLPSTEIGLLLLEVYFKRVYNATLLFHKPTAFEAYRRNEMPGYLLRAIFAHAATFLEQAGPEYEQHVKIIPIPVLFQKSWSWARSASREVLSFADEPTLPRVQALQVLQLFYFSRGEIQRADVHLSLAHRLCRILGFDRLPDGTPSDLTSRSEPFERDRKRRCFWSVWCSARIANHQVELPLALGEIPSLPPPASFTARGPLQEAKSDLDRKPECWRPDQPSLPADYSQADIPRASFMKTIVTLLNIWSHVQDLQRRSPALSHSQRKRKVDELFDLVEPVRQSLDLPWTDIETQAESFHESPELLVSVCSVYYAISFLLHVLLVPSLPGCSAESPHCDSTSVKKADMALHQAVSFARLMRQFVTKGFDITRLWPFVGYASFVAGSVLLTLDPRAKPIKSQDLWLQAPQSSAEEVNTVQTILEVLGIYWKPLRGLGLRLRAQMSSGKPGDIITVTSPVYPWHLPSGEYPAHGQHGPAKALVRANPSESTRGLSCVGTISADPVTSHDVDYHLASSLPRQAPPRPDACTQAAETDGSPGYHMLPVGDAYDYEMEELVASSGDGNMDWWYSAPMDHMLDFSTAPIG